MTPRSPTLVPYFGDGVAMMLLSRGERLNCVVLGRADDPCRCGGVAYAVQIEDARYGGVPFTVCDQNIVARGLH